MKFDLIIVGAGTAGCIAAKFAAKSGLSVCLIEKKEKVEIGRKVCGDSVGKHHFDRIGISYPSKDELACKVKGVKIYSPDQGTEWKIEKGEYEGFVINRREFGQRLLNEALDEGVVLFDNTLAVQPLMRENFVNGVIVKNLETGQKQEIEARATIDASGISASLRRKLPSEWGFENVDLYDMVLCYREIRRLATEIDTDYCSIYLNQEIFPGGYAWIFPKGTNVVNVGLGIQMKEAYPNPKEHLYEYILSRPLFQDSGIIEGGSGLVSTRRPLSPMVGNGFLIVGDAACLSNPIHGGGIGPSMLSGKLAAEAVVEALERGEATSALLWKYSLKYIEAYGAKQASLDIFRLFLQSLSNDELNFGMSKRLIKEDELFKASLYGRIEVSFTEKIKRCLRGLRKPRLLSKLGLTSRLMRAFKNLYLNYPKSPSEFAIWKHKTDYFYAYTKSLLSK